MPPPARGKGHCCDELRRSRRLCRTRAYVSIVLADEMDALTNEPSGSNDFGPCLARGEVIGTPLAQVAFDLVDAIWLQDERIAEVVGADPTG